MTRNLKYLVDLEALHVPHSMQSFEECNKERLVQGIWKTRSREGRVSTLFSSFKACSNILFFKGNILLFAPEISSLVGFILTQFIPTAIILEL
jgi:hypothetical protein